MKDDNERVEALNAIFDDDPAKKAREKEIEKLEKKREKQLAKLKKKGIDAKQKQFLRSRQRRKKRMKQRLML